MVHQVNVASEESAALSEKNSNTASATKTATVAINVPANTMNPVKASAQGNPTSVATANVKRATAKTVSHAIKTALVVQAPSAMRAKAHAKKPRSVATVNANQTTKKIVVPVLRTVNAKVHSFVSQAPAEKKKAVVMGRVMPPEAKTVRLASKTVLVRQERYVNLVSAPPHVVMENATAPKAKTVPPVAKTAHVRTMRPVNPVRVKFHLQNQRNQMQAQHKTKPPSTARPHSKKNSVMRMEKTVRKCAQVVVDVRQQQRTRRPLRSCSR